MDLMHGDCMVIVKTNYYGFVRLLVREEWFTVVDRWLCWQLD